MLAEPSIKGRKNATVLHGVIQTIKIVFNLMELQFRKILSDYLPQESLNFFVQFFMDNKVSLKITRDRKTRLGCFVRKRTELPLITINNGLNKYFFSIVLAHEIAHYISWQNNKHKRLLPHGKEWKAAYEKLLKELIAIKIFPNDIEDLLHILIDSNFTSSKAEFELNYALKKYQSNKESTVLLKDIADGEEFIYNGVKFKKIKTKTHRCSCVKTGVLLRNTYSFHLLAEVEVC